MSRQTYSILHEDPTLLVVNKAAGVLTVSAPKHPGRCLLDDLRRDGHKVAPIHRLDKETSGVLLLCLDRDRRKDLEDLFKQREVTKEYLALVHGRPPSRTGLIDLPILERGATPIIDRRGREALTRYEVVETFGPKGALLRVFPETGRHNQIRLHLAHIGYPLVGDRKFGRRRTSAQERADGPHARRTLLHAERLCLPHPARRRRLDVRCDPPADFEDCLASWRQQG
ncbi:MAG: 23S rRNA pseudouridine1911/1915/1917 synthase [Pseudohongiellaceae bacterium]|jgi:23S rRNA pseudouridine1911/1915/1917 synthase